MDVGSWVPTAGDGAANFTPANLLLASHSGTGLTPGGNGLSNNSQQHYITDQAYRDFTTTIQVFILIGSLLGNGTVLWCTCCTSVFKSVTSLFIKNLACSGICAGLMCVPFDVALGASPRCCWWLHTLLLCKALKFLHKLFCSVTVLSFAAIALDRYYSVLYPLERKISDARSRDLVIYIWIHATIASVPVFALTNVTDVYATSSCSDARARSLGHMVYVLTYNVTTVILPLVVVFLLMILIRRALNASQKKKVIIAALRTPQNSISIPYVSQREAELHATLLAVVLAFSACSAPYGALVVYRTLLGDGEDLSPSLHLTAIWLPKVSLLTNPLLFLTVNGSARRCLFDVLVRVHRRYSRRNVVSTGDLGLRGEGGLGGSGTLEGSARAGSQLLEMFNIGQQQIFRPTDEEEEEVENASPSLGSGVGGCPHPNENHHQAGGGGGGGRHGGKVVLQKETEPTRESVPVTKEQPPLLLPEVSPVRACAYTSSSQVAPATPRSPRTPPSLGSGHSSCRPSGCRRPGTVKEAPPTAREHPRGTDPDQTATPKARTTNQQEQQGQHLPHIDP